MNILLDKLGILIVSFILFISNVNDPYLIVPFLVSITLSTLLSYLENQRFKALSFVVFIAVSFLMPSFRFFLPLITYDVISTKPKWFWCLSFLPIATSLDSDLVSNLLIGGLVILVFILSRRTSSIQELTDEYKRLRDNAVEISTRLEKQNKELLDKQDYEIHLATLSERNRIARDIHDNVGHLISRSILQVGALLAVNKDEKIKEELHQIKNSLSEAMDSIRASVHGLYDESIDLRAEIDKLIDSFEFCPVKFYYDVESKLAKNIKFCFIAVIKEALANIIKHSDATEASITVRELPAIYQLIIKDNGSSVSCNIENGIGLKNISDRVAALGGNVNITSDNGFRIFISIPKGKTT
ncbi:MAG: sensor histidine kinase [Clostridiaceae bacterium]|nr:sensor histidine kinase [Clostridiaceae bacterium]